MMVLAPLRLRGEDYVMVLAPLHFRGEDIVGDTGFEPKVFNLFVTLAIVWT